MASVPPSRHIADELRRAINAGELQQGTKLPSERALAQQYGTARNTARQAIAILQAEGLVEAEHGRGVFVRSTRRLLRISGDRYSRRHRADGKAPFRAEVERQGGTARVDVPAIDIVDPSQDIAHRLGIDDDTQVVRRTNHYYADDRLVQLVTTYIPAPIANEAGLLTADVGPGGIYARLDDAGYRLAQITEDIVTRMPTPDESRALRIPPGVPVLDVLHTSADENERIFEVTRFVLPGDRHTLSYTLSID